MRITSLSSRRRKAVAVVGIAAAATAAVLATAPSASAASVALTLSATSGPSGGLNSLTGTTATTAFASGFAVEFQYKATSSTACTAAYSTVVTPATGVGIVAVSAPKLLTNKKIAFTVPAGVSLTPAGSAASAAWNVCVYSSTNTTTGLLVANAAYTVAAAPTVSAISPSSGPALGGGTVTITGTNFTTGTTAKIGGVALTGVTVAANGLTLTGTVPAQAANDDLAVSVSNTGGTATLASAYDYTNGIVISPNTAPTNTASTDVDVTGVGFSNITFSATTGSTPTSANGHVFLVDGDYDPTDSGGNKTEPEIGECINVLVISDGELICTVNTADSDGAGSSGTVIGNGTYTLTVVGNGGVDVQPGGGNEAASYSKSIVSSGSVSAGVVVDRVLIGGLRRTAAAVP